jgi:formylglycine-generating enzyme required for sulfatase activity
MLLYRKSNGEQAVLAEGSCLGVGGEAGIFLVTSDPLLVAKIYHRPTDQYMRKLEVMLANPPTDPTAGQGHISIAWPTDLLNADSPAGRCAGFLMPRVTDMLRIMDFFNPRTRRTKSPLFSYLYLHRTARNLAASFHALHEKGYVVGDVNESNILVKETAMVTLVDTDSFQIPDRAAGVVYRCPVGKPEYTPRELHGRPFDREDRLPEHDRFGLAVLLFQLLMEGTHPFDGVYRGRGEAPSIMTRIAAGHFPFAKEWLGQFAPPASAPEFEILHPRLRELFLRCFCEGHEAPRQRPSAAEWRDALIDTEGELATCNVNEQHRYGRHLAACPWCDRIARLGCLDPFPSPQAVQHGLHLEPAAPVQAPLPSPTKLAPDQPRETRRFAEPDVEPLPLQTWFMPSPRRLCEGLPRLMWHLGVAAALAVSWSLGLVWTAWLKAGLAGLAATLIAMTVLRLGILGQGKALRRAPWFWCCVLSVLVQLSICIANSGGPALSRCWRQSVQYITAKIAQPGRAVSMRPLDFKKPEPPLPSPATPTAATTPPPSEAVIPPAAPATNPPPVRLIQLSQYRRTNSLGMVFLPVPHTNCPVFVCMLETRAQDCEVFLQATGQPRPKQGLPEGNCPANNVNWTSADAFCRWLTAKERAEGSIGTDDQYRLPSEQEWGAALGLFNDSYPWGPQWPAPDGGGNLYETRWKQTRSIAPAGSFVANEFGIFDLCGNVAEWSADASPQRPNERRLLGGSYRTSFKDVPRLRADDRYSLAAEKFTADVGFRVVLDSQASRAFMQDLVRPDVAVILPPPAADRRWANSLGMRFLPLTGTNVLFAIWETRVKDYAPFARDKQIPVPRPRFAQTDDHPVVNVSWEEALAFCQWLTCKEQHQGRIGRDQKYRLPTDIEWSRAIGLGSEQGATPAERHERRDDHGYPWGARKWSVPQNAGNYSRWDSFEFTAPVGSFPANRLGLYDLSGNVWEWCSDEIATGRPVLRGGSFADPYDVNMPDPLLSAHRSSDLRETRRETTGFRIVIDLNSAQ